ncbi:MAG: metallophosphoesterase [Paracoccaceae bacterium]
MTVYAIGDIHGHRDKLESALERIEADGGSHAPVVFLGDLVDRGPDSRGVIELLRRGCAGGRPWTVLKGNHDLLFQRFLEHGALFHPRVRGGAGWLHPRLGGVETLASYGVDAGQRDTQEVLAAARGAVPGAHRRFLGDLPLWHIAGDLLFVHAGIRPGVPLAAQDPEDLLWIRDEFLDWTGAHPWLVVHGHTAQPYPVHCGNRINLDGGAGHGRDLVPAVFEGREAFLLEPGGRVRL